MLMNLLVGLPTLVACLFLQSLLLIAAMRYCSRHDRACWVSPRYSRHTRNGASPSWI